MGVRGLFTFMQKNKDKTWVKYELHNTKLVIDGYNLSGNLAHSMGWNPYGGEHDKFYQKTKQLFQDLILCKVKCYVIFDGGLTPEKIAKSYAKYQEILDEGYRIRETPFCYRRIFKQILDELNIYNVVSDIEADQEMAALAVHFNCPVLSNDTDFVIYNIKCIPFQFLDKPRLKKNMKKISMSCITYDGTMFQKHFGIALEVLPLMAMLIGNDFMDKKVLEEFHTIMDVGKNPLAAVLAWLKDKSLDQACNEFYDMFPNKSRDTLESIVKVSLDEYEIVKCRLVDSFSSKVKPKQVLDQNNNNTESLISHFEYNGHVYTKYSKPEWLYNKIMYQSLPASYLNLYIWKMYFYTIQFENLEDDPSLVPSLPIVRFAFDVLNDFKVKNFVLISRCKTQMAHTEIGRSIALNKPKFKPFPLCDKIESQKYFIYFIQFNFPGIEQNLKSIPNDFQLILLTLLWFVKECKVPSSLAYSLILSYVTVGIVNVKATVKSFKNTLAQLLSNCQRDLKEMVQDKDAAKPVKPVKITKTDQILPDDCHKAKSLLDSFFELVKQDSESFDENIKKVHLLMQHLNILQQINLLNELLGFPFTCTPYGKYYNGIFVKNVWQTIENIGLKDFNLKFLPGSSTVDKFFMYLCELLDQNMKRYDLSFYETNNN